MKLQKKLQTFCSLSFSLTLCILLVRKMKQALTTYECMYRCSESVSLASMEESSHFKDFVTTLRNHSKPPSILFLNRFALNMTFNWLCNTHQMVDVHDRAVFVTMDKQSNELLKATWPNLKRFYWPTKCLTV